MRATERWSFELNCSRLPRANYVIGAPFSDKSSDFVDERNTFGWNAKLAVEYAIPLGNWGLHATTRTGFSQSNIKRVETRISTDADGTTTSFIKRVSTRLRDPFLGIGLRVPFPTNNGNWDLSMTWTHIFADEVSVNQTLSAQLLYNFR